MDQPWSGRKLHFVGILGAGMSGLAKVARILGAEVSGSDRALNGHDAANVPDGAEVVYSSAIGPENPERRPPEMHRADLLGELTRLKPTIAVSGTHGKTTTTSMIVHAMDNPSYLVGGEVRSTATNADWTDGRWLVVEADDADRSLLKLHPTIAVVTNAELDHHTTYASSKDVDDTFAAFLALAEQAVVPPELLRLPPPPPPPPPATPPRAAAARARGHRLRAGEPDLEGPGRAQPPQRRRGPDRDPARGRGRRAG